MRALLFVFVAACATTPVTPKETTATPAAKRADDDVASAFDEKPVASTAPAITPPPPEPDVRVTFRAAVDSARAALSSKQLDRAADAAATATTEAAALGAAEKQRAAELTATVALAKKTPDVEAIRVWRQSCAGEAADTCRAQALKALSTAAQVTKERELADEATELSKSETCLKTAERSKKPEKCFATLVTSDPFIAAKLQYVKALAAPDAKRPALLEAVAERCEAAACVPVRRKALADLIARAKAEKRLEEAARLAMKDLKTHATLFTKAERIWARPAEVDAVCALYDATKAGACRALEKQLTGGFTFRDFSSERQRDGLPSDVVRTVNEHYGPLLQECLAVQAKRLKAPDTMRFELRWMVFNDGRVGEVHFKDAAQERSELAACIRAQFSTWRYPKYEGEWQHVEQSFSVMAVERR